MSIITSRAAGYLKHKKGYLGIYFTFSVTSPKRTKRKKKKI